jgi:O-antigen/teichoic acid export membrane protein
VLGCPKVQPGIVIAAAALALGAGVMLLGIVRTVTAHRRVPALRRAVATTITGSGISALGLALLMLSVGKIGIISVSAAGIVAIVGLAQLVRAAAMIRSER